MTNGQLNVVSVPATQLVTQESTVPAAVTKDGVQQSGGGFDGVLNGVQLSAKAKASHDSMQAGKSRISNGTDQLEGDDGTDQHTVSLPQAPQKNTPASNTSMLQPDDQKKEDLNAAVVPQGSELSNITSLIVLSAYSQSGRTPEVNIPTALPVDRQQNAATASEQSAVITVPVVKNQTGHTVAELTEAATEKPAAQTASAVQSVQSVVQPAPALKTAEVNVPTVVPVDRLQNVAPASELPAAITAPVVKNQTERTVAEPTETALEKPAAQPAAEQNQQRQPETVRTTAVDGQPVTTVAAVPAIQVTQTAVPAPAVTQSSQAPATALNPVAVAPVSSPEAEVEIQLSQPRPITARVAASPAVADNRSAGVVQETQNGRLRRTPEQLAEKSRAGTEPSAVKELTTSLQSIASDGESALGSDTSRGDGNQRQPDSSPDNQVLLQRMSGQLSTEHQKVSAVTTRSVPTESMRQDIPEQVMQQVKERLVQHDVKPGSQQITLTLSPDSLGELKMNLNLQGQKLSVEIVTENRTVRDAIVQHTDALKESLARQNITMSSFDVTTGGKGSGNQGQNQSAWRELAQQQQQQQQQQSWTLPRGYHVAQADLPSDQAAYQRQQGQTMLDIHY